MRRHRRQSNPIKDRLKHRNIFFPPLRTSWREPTFRTYSKSHKDENGRWIFDNAEITKALYGKNIRGIRTERLLDRLRSIVDKGYHLEGLLLGSQIIEILTKECVITAERIVRKSIPRSGRIKSPLFFRRGIDKAPLGKLIDYLEVYIKKRFLVSRLRQFLKYRNLVTHNLLDSKHNFNKIRRDVEGYIKRGALYKLIFQIYALSVFLEDDLRDRKYRYENQAYWMGKYLQYIPEKYWRVRQPRRSKKIDRPRGHPDPLGKARKWVAHL